MQIRNSSSLVQQSAKFIPKQLLQNKQMLDFLSYAKYTRYICICFVLCQLFDKAFVSTFHVTFIKIINVYQNNRHWLGNK